MTRVLVACGALVSAYVVSAAAMPVIARYARHHRLLDVPDDPRRQHVRPVPRLAGVGVIAGALAGAVALMLLATPGSVRAPSPLGLALVASCAMLFLAGLLDDLRGVPPLGKLAAQTAAALLVYAAGFRIETLGLPPDIHIALGGLALPVTVLWLVGLSNAFNLVDGLDGLAGGIAAIALLATAVTAAILGNADTTLRSVAVLGAVLGFLRFNFPPARIFLGDSGSLVIGFLLGVLTVRGATRADGTTVVLAPIFALSYPLLDTGISMLRRWLRGDPLSRADGRHIHHQLRKLGLSPRQAVMLLYAGAVAVALLGLSATFASPRLTVAIGAAGGAALLFVLVYGLRWLQYHEFLEAGASISGAVREGRTVIRDKIRARDIADLLLQARSLDQIDRVLSEEAVSFRFVHAQLEDRHARSTLIEPLPVQRFGAQTWCLEYPVAPFTQGATHPLSLVIWCAMDGRGTPAGAERVARILAPAIARWLAAHWAEPALQEALAERFPAAKTPAWGMPALRASRGPKLLA